MVSFLMKLKTVVSSFNLFKNESTDRSIVRCQRLATGVFLILFITLSINLIIYTWISENMTTHTVHSPHQSKIEELQSSHPYTLNCLCNQISIPYNKLINDHIIYHEICSSQFVSEEWIEQSYQGNITHIWPLDIRSISSAFSQILRSFCLLSNKSVADAQITFGSKSMITTKVLSSLQFNIQIESLTKFIQKSTTTNLNLMIELIYGIMEGNQLISGLGTNLICQLYDNMTNPSNERQCSFSSFCTEWKGGCYPLESLLSSTLECFYNLTCLNFVVANNKQIQPLDKNKQKHPTSTTVRDILKELFINEWNSTGFYEKYIKECAPKLCSYSRKDRLNIIEIVTILFGLIGGLTIGLELLVGQTVLRLLIFITMRKRRRQVFPGNTDPYNRGSNAQEGNMSFKQRFVTFAQRGRRNLIKINIFSKTIWIRKENIQRQLWASRFFIVCLVLAFAIQTMFISIEKKTKQITILSPNQSQFENLSSSNQINLHCPCTNIVINYEKLFNINPIYHQICTSKFIDEKWYTRLHNIGLTHSHDFRWSANTEFQLLSLLCQITNRTIDVAFHQFESTPFISHSIFESKLFEFQARAISNHFIKTTTNQFARTLRLARSLTAASQFITLAGTNAYGHVTPDFLVFYKQNTFDSEVLLKPECYCSRDLHCQKESNIYDFNVPGFIMGCFPLDSLLGSSLVCLYNKTCINHTLSFFPDQNIDRVVLDANESTRFTHQATVETIINELFIEDWQMTHSYSSFYNECMPSHCTYSITSKNNILFIITSLIGLYGGLNEALKLILPHLVNLIARIIKKFKRRQNREVRPNQDDDSHISRIRAKASEFNIFRPTVNNSVIAQEQRNVTRLYMIILFILLVVLALYKGIQQYSITGIVKKPSQAQFENLYGAYDDSLQCSASQISTEYVSITDISYSTHQICTSEFLKKNFTDYLFHKIDLPLAQDDFRSYAMSFFHLLDVLCLLTQEILTDSLTEFYRTSLINTRVLSQREFQSKTRSILLEFEQKLSTNFMESLKIFQDYAQGNQLITLTASNWKFAVQYNSTDDLVRSIPIIRSNCSCATSNLCFEPAKLYLNDNHTVTIQGFQIGCTPLDSILSSTLECFYKQSCINYLIDAFNISLNVNVLELNRTQFALNTTIETLVKNLFIEKWNSSTNYSNYYAQIRPTQCFYSYIKRNNLLSVIIEILGIYGGLTVALRFILPTVIRFVVKIKQRFQNRRGTIQMSTINLQQ